MADSHIAPTIAEPDAPVFSALITPHRSLGVSGTRIVLTLCCIATIVSSIPFIIVGAWPVAGFFGLDLLALYVAFRVNRRSAGAAEEVVLTRINLWLRRIGVRGETSERRFNPQWTRLDRVRDDEFGLQSLALVSRGERVVIARDLSPAERESFADAFGEALAQVKRG